MDLIKEIVQIERQKQGTEWPYIDWEDHRVNSMLKEFERFKPLFEKYKNSRISKKYHQYKTSMKRTTKTNEKFTEDEDAMLHKRTIECRTRTGKIDWKTILNLGGFSETRDTESLQNRWKYLKKIANKPKNKPRKTKAAPKRNSSQISSKGLPDIFKGKSWKERQFGFRYFRSCDTLEYYRDLCEDRAKIEPEETVEMHMKAILGIEKGEIEDLNNFLKGNLSNRDLQALARRSHDLSTIEGEFLFSQEEIFLHVVRKNHVDENESVNWDRFITSRDLVRSLGEEGRELNKAQLASKWNNHKRRKTK